MKKYFSSNTTRGLSIYVDVIRLTVDACILTAAGTPLIERTNFAQYIAKVVLVDAW